MRKICILTTTRADYGLLRPLLRAIQSDSRLELQIMASGAHLSPEFGLTVKDIEADGFRVDSRVEILLSADTATAISKSMGLALLATADELMRLKCDIFVLLGDRFEVFAAAAAATACRIPIAHIHGGEMTAGAMDEAFRHSITKMAHLHFTATEVYRRRVIQLGEHPDRVFTVGALGVDSILESRLLGRQELTKRLGIQWRSINLLVTFHPATLDESRPADQFAELLAALEELEDACIILTKPNADSGGRELIGMVDRFAAAQPDSRFAFVTMGHLNYLSALALCDVVVGNSSSGIIEAPSFHVGVVNIGDRQMGRVKAAGVIDCAPERAAIGAAIKKALNSEFRAALKDEKSPYGNGNTAPQIKEILERFPLEQITKKVFFDLPEPISDINREALS